MNSEVTGFDSWCNRSWGAPTRNTRQLLARNTPRIQDNFDFKNLSPSVKFRIVETLILESCSHYGSFSESGDVSWFIWNFGRELDEDGTNIEGRSILPTKAALLLTAHSTFPGASSPNCDDLDYILGGGGAIAATYFLTRVEYLCRVKGRYLDSGGRIKKQIPTCYRNKWQLRANQSRINRIEQAFILYLYRNKTLAGTRLRILDNKFRSMKKLRIAERLARLRNPVMHGELGDPAVESRFLALLIAMFWYGEHIK